LSNLLYPKTDSAIAQFEGYGQAGTLATINNNPGNLVWGSFALSHGATGIDPNGFAIFPNSDSGSTAEDALVNYYAIKNATISDLISAWAPPTAPGNTPSGTQSYTDFVARALNATPSTLVTAAENGITQNDASPQQPNSSLSNLASILGSLAGNAIAPGMGSTITSIWGRVAALIIGLIFIAGAIYLFRPVNQVVNKTVKSAITA
jgi:hypothetical protein